MREAALTMLDPIMYLLYEAISHIVEGRSCDD